jgi:hypothetical protein
MNQKLMQMTIMSERDHYTWSKLDIHQGGLMNLKNNKRDRRDKSVMKE